MKVGENQVFNLMDTNGRRSDVINALQGYLGIVDNIINVRRMKWQPLPHSLAQFEFYKQAIELSPDVFKKHDKFDNLMLILDEYPELKAAVFDCDIDWIRANYDEIDTLFDLGVEDRARHYTSNLVKLGFVDDNRKISDVGYALLGNKILHKDELERMLPLNDMNIIYLRQLLKLRIFSTDEKQYYSPFCLAMFALLRKERISQNEFCELVQGLGPYSKIDNIDEFVKNYQDGGIIEDYIVKIPIDIDINEQLDNSIFIKYFKNRKSKSTVQIYYEFYKALYQFNKSRNAFNLNKLLDIYENEKSMLNKAFGYGKNIFSTKLGDRPDVEAFIEQEEEDFFAEDLNTRIYRRFNQSKMLDIIREYSDTTMRIFKATGLISFENGYVELAYRDLCSCIFDIDKIRQRIMGNIEDEVNPYYDCYGDYDDGLESFYCSVRSVAEIFEYSDSDIMDVVATIQKEFAGAPIKDIPRIVEDRRKEKFVDFIEKYYPEDRVKRLLGLFSNRTNDVIIKKEVSPDATVPTIYEYVIGLAWYYFSNRRIDLLGSFNLTLTADFEPLTHAGGGMGDIVIYEDKQVIMLEATLMNANSQKRGEWEPVLRHSVNLKIEEEKKETNREVTTFFIADSFDYNTINIWKAISTVPLQSSVDKDKFTDNVVIMPIDNEELSKLLDRKDEYDDIIQQVRKLFIADKVSFDRDWRNKFIKEVIYN